MDCIDLRERFGDRYKVAFDESYYAERSDFRSAEKLGLTILRCVNGHICPWGGSDLAACTRGARSVAKRLRALPFVRVVQDGADGINAVFDAAHFDEVARIMRPRRRRRLSPEARQAAGVRLAKYQYKPAVGFAPKARPCVKTGSGVS